VSDLQDHWNSDGEQLRQGREQLTAAQAQNVILRETGQKLHESLASAYDHNKELQAELAELRRELEALAQANTAVSREKDAAVKREFNISGMLQDAESRACTPAERAVLEAMSKAEARDLRYLCEAHELEGACAELARRATREQPAVTPEQIREALQKGVRDARIVAGDPVMPAPVSGAKEGDE
jgi:chromosome segregation ATPase